MCVPGWGEFGSLCTVSLSAPSLQSDVGLACASPRALTSCTQLSGTHPNATSVLLRSHCRRGDPRIAGKQHTRVFMVVVALRAVDCASRTKAEGMVGNTTE